MLSGCANGSCSSKFLYLHEGKLFVLGPTANKGCTSVRLDSPGEVEALRYAWLCDECATKFEVVLDSQGSVKLRNRLSDLKLAS